MPYQTGKESHPLAMSKDRITFFLAERRYEDNGLVYRKMIHDVFDLSEDGYRGACHYFAKTGYHNGVMITCRPSQFGRFMVMRNTLGFTNDVKGLEATLFQPQPEKPTVVDVSKRSNRVWATDSEVNYRDRV